MVDAKRPAIESYLIEDVRALAKPPSSNDWMGWATGTAALHPPVDDDPAGLATALDDLVQSLDLQTPLQYQVAEARDNMEILLAGYQSIATGQEIALPLARRKKTR